MTDARIAVFLQKLAGIDGTAALSDAKIKVLRHRENVVVIEEAHEIVALGVAARHEHLDGKHHWAIETALEPGLRFPAFEERLLEASLALAPAGEPMSVWSHRRSLDAALTKAGFHASRALGYFTVQLPIADPHTDSEPRTFELRDFAEIVHVNRSAFSAHREAASLDEAELARLLDQEGMGPGGFLVVEEDDTIVGFCWTRIHSNGDGEIFRIAVSLAWQGRGLGRGLVLAGFHHLATQSGVKRGTLWVDLENVSAVNLYRDIGMSQEAVNREFEKLGAGG